MLNGVKESMCSLSLRNTASQVISLGLVVSTILMIWHTLILLTGTQSPVIVVISGSMEPGFRRGDILFVILDKSPFNAGEILVFKIKDKDIPIVHRVIKVHRQRDSDQVNLLTKGDNNKLDDSYGRIYANGQLWLENSDIIGRVKGYLPYLGYATIIVTEQPLIKYLLITGLSLLAIFSSTKSH